MGNVARKVDLHFISCKSCTETTIIMTAKSKGLDGFIKHGCTHSVHLLLMEMLKDKLAARKKLSRVAGNPNGRKKKRGAG